MGGSIRKEIVKSMIRPATVQDVMDFAPTMREADVEEVKATVGLDPLDALAIAYFQSDQPCVAYNRYDEVVGIIGVVPLVPNKVGSVWFLSSDAVTRGVKTMVIEAREWLDEQNALYPVLCNVVAESNVVHRRLLKHLGFDFKEPVDNYGAGKIRVIPFERTT